MDQGAAPVHAGELLADVQGKQIHCPDGPVGQVADVLVDPVTERPSYLIWREAVLVTKEVSIPIEYIDRIDGDQIVLRVEREAIERLPHFWTTDPSAAVHISKVERY